MVEARCFIFSPSHLFIRQKGAYTQGVGKGVTLLTAVTNGFSKPIFHITGSGLGSYLYALHLRPDFYDLNIRISGTIFQSGNV